MKTVVYADVLFAVNFAMDLLSVWLTFLIVHQKTSAPRIVIASVIGGAYGVLSVIMDVNGVASFICGMTVSFIMIFVSTPGKLSFIKYIKYTFVLWGVGALCGGIITAVCAIGGNSYGLKTHNAPFFILALGASAAFLVIRLFSDGNVSGYRTVGIKMFGHPFEFTALVDSGNLVKEPISGAPVIFVSEGVLTGDTGKVLRRAVLPKSGPDSLPDSLKRRTRVIMTDGADGKRVKTAFIPDETYILLKKRMKKVRAVVVIENRRDYGGYQGVIPSSLLR